MHRFAPCLLALAAGLASINVSAADRFSLYPFKVSSESGFFQLDLSGRLILEGFAPGREGAGLIADGANFLSGRASVFADAFIGNRIYAAAELRLDTGEVPRKGELSGRLEQAFLRVTPSRRHNLHLQYGRFVSPFGSYNQRHDTAADPFIRPPLMYDYRTMVSANFVPRTNNGFLAWKLAPDIWRPRGAPIIWGNPYQIGFMAFGGFRKVDFRLAVMNSAPSSEPEMWYYQIGRETHPSYVAHLGYRILPEFYIGAAYNAGPYLGDGARAVVGDERFNSYWQKVWEVEFLFERGKTQVRGEAFHDTWEVENVFDEPVDVSGYVEIKQKFLTGFYGALRFGAIHYSRIRRSTGTRDPWDFNTRRWQAALGYQITRHVEVRTEYMWNHTSGYPDPSDNLLSLQGRFQF